MRDRASTEGLHAVAPLGIRAPGHGAHADHEHIEVDQIAGRAALLVALLAQL